MTYDFSSLILAILGVVDWGGSRKLSVLLTFSTLIMGGCVSGSENVQHYADVIYGWSLTTFFLATMWFNKSLKPNNKYSQLSTEHRHKGPKIVSVDVFYLKNNPVAIWSVKEESVIYFQKMAQFDTR